MATDRIRSYLFDHYNIQPKAITYIRSSVNDVYRVSTTDQTYYFRIEPDRHVFGSGRLAIESSLLNQMHQKLEQVMEDHISLAIPRPLRRDDHSLTGDFGQRSCVLLTEVKGRKVVLDNMSAKQLDRIVLAMAEMHDLLEGIDLDHHLLLLEQVSHSLDSYEKHLDLLDSGDHEDHLDWARDLVERIAQQNLPTQLLHGDLWHKNILVDDTGKVGFIDFDFTMIGPRSYDLAAFLATRKSFGLALQPEMERRVIEQYQATSGWNFAENEILMMQQLRQLWILKYWLEYSDLSTDVIDESIQANIAGARYLWSP